MNRETIKLYWENPALNRYYRAHLTKDLLGDWILVKAWGGKGNRLGRVQRIFCDSYDQGILLLNKVKKQRKNHGYQIIS